MACLVFADVSGLVKIRDKACLVSTGYIIIMLIVNDSFHSKVLLKVFQILLSHKLMMAVVIHFMFLQDFYLQAQM